MQRILFSLDKLRQYTAAESLLIRLAEWFLQRGWSVDITARLIDGDHRQQLTQLSATWPLRLFIDNDSPSVQGSSGDLYHQYQLIWVCNSYLSARLIERMHQGELLGRCLFQHFSASGPGISEENCALESSLAWRIVTDSPRSYAAQRLRGAPGPVMRLLPLAFDDDHSGLVCPPGDELKQILWATQSLTPAIVELTAMLRLRGIRLDVMLITQQTEPLTNQQLSHYQLVVAEHQLVARALCLGIPVCIAGQGGWHGYLTEQSLTVDSDNFFIARGGSQPEISQHCDVLINGYAAAQQWASSFKSTALQNWSLSALLPPLLDSLPTADWLTLSDAEANEWRMVRNILAQQVDASRPLLQWLKQREISETRRAALTAIITGQGEVARMGVIILDRMHDRALCENSLLSVRQQSLVAEHCLLISTQHYPSLLKGHEVQLSVAVDGQALHQAATRFITNSWLVIEAGTRCLRDSLLLFAEHLLQHPGIQVCYSDILQGASPEEAQLLLKPDCNIDLLRSQHYPGEELLVTGECMKQYLAKAPISNELIFCELIWRIIEHAGPPAVGHLPEALLLIPERPLTNSLPTQRREITLRHLQRCCSDGWIEPGANGQPDQLRYPLPRTASVSIIIVTRDNQTLLRRCLDSLTEHTCWPDYELLIVDNGSRQEDACDYLNQLQALKLRNLKILRWPDSFNFAAINNYAATMATGDYLLFLNNDCSFNDSGWLNAMLEIAHRPEVGVTGARQLFADDRIQHAGFITGYGSGVAEIFRDSPSSAAGYSHYLQTIQQVSAVSASCMLVRRSVFDTSGGFDARHFSGGAADIDFCLRVRQHGYLVVWTPQATLQHMGGATRLSEACYPAEAIAEQQGNDALRERWQGALCQDLRYHRHFTRVGQPFSLSHRTARVQPPLPGRPLPVMMAGHVNYTGCGHYRVIQPYQLLEQQLHLEGGLIHGLPAAMEVAALQPDILLLQMPFDPQIEETLRHYRQLSGTKIIMEYDDYFLRLPRQNHNRHKLPKDIATRLRRTMDCADHLVVSTAALASAYSGLHCDIRVAQNRLNPLQWGGLTSARCQGRKPRLGWAGGNSHDGDLAILRPLAEALGDEVEWVFMGMKPSRFRCEFHSGVPFDWYPQKLASLNLDLALVPLEINLFNECKSNLRLLELGACGIPVICSDIEPYRGLLPVTCVKNHFRHWMKAIREHLSDPQALAAKGDALQQAVRRDWLLTPQSLTEWQQAWLD